MSSIARGTGSGMWNGMQCKRIKFNRIGILGHGTLGSIHFGHNVCAMCVYIHTLTYIYTPHTHTQRERVCARAPLHMCMDKYYQIPSTLWFMLWVRVHCMLL